jgi:hypothetical protein
MVRRLSNLKIREVSSVDKGANPGAEVLLLKRNGSSPFDRYFNRQIDRASEALTKSIKSIIDDTSIDETEQQELIDKSVDQAIEYLTTIAADLQIAKAGALDDDPTPATNTPAPTLPAPAATRTSSTSAPMTLAENEILIRNHVERVVKTADGASIARLCKQELAAGYTTFSQSDRMAMLKAALTPGKDDNVAWAKAFQHPANVHFRQWMNLPVHHTYAESVAKADSAVSERRDLTKRVRKMQPAGGDHPSAACDTPLMVDTTPRVLVDAPALATADGGANAAVARSNK